MLSLVPISFKEANEFVARFHRHHGKMQGCKFCVAVSDENRRIRAVAIIGRPVARHFDDGWTLEVNRVCSDGERNACSMLYAAAWRVAKNLGYKRVISYILNNENGKSLISADYKLIGECGGGTWNSKNRPRVDLHPLQKKFLFEKR